MADTDAKLKGGNSPADAYKALIGEATKTISTMTDNVNKLGNSDKPA